MARLVKNRLERRQEIIETARQFFYSQGYEEASIQGIIDAVGIAKGTFYHYFSSKAELLDALLDQMMGETLRQVEPLVTDDRLNAIDKFNRFFGDIESWKIENKAFFLQALHVLYKDENIVLRHKMRLRLLDEVLPPLTAIIEQGIAEGIFATRSASDAAEIVLTMAQVLSESIAQLLLEPQPRADLVPLIEQKVSAYQEAVERALCAPAGSITIFATDRLKIWFE